MRDACHRRGALCQRRQKYSGSLRRSHGEPGDIIVAGEDGVVVVPQAKAAEVLKESRNIDARESKMIPLIKQYKSLQKVVEMFKRI